MKNEADIPNIASAEREATDLMCRNLCATDPTHLGVTVARFHKDLSETLMSRKEIRAKYGLDKVDEQLGVYHRRSMRRIIAFVAVMMLAFLSVSWIPIYRQEARIERSQASYRECRLAGMPADECVARHLDLVNAE